MTREELREHCKKQIQHCEQWAEWNREEPHGKVYEEHKLILELLKQEPKTGYLILLDECSNSGYYCSKCHKKVVKEGWSNTVKKIKFCPNCGVKIQEIRND